MNLEKFKDIELTSDDLILLMSKGLSKKGLEGFKEKISVNFSYKLTGYSTDTKGKLIVYDCTKMEEFLRYVKDVYVYSVYHDVSRNIDYIILKKKFEFL